MVHIEPICKGSNGDADIGNRLRDTGSGEKGEDGTDGETSMETYTLLLLKSLQLCLTLCDPIDSSLPGSSIHGIFQARVLEWIAIAFSDKIDSQWKFSVWLSELKLGLCNNLVGWEGV